MDAAVGRQAKLYETYCERRRTPRGAKIPSLHQSTFEEFEGYFPSNPSRRRVVADSLIPGKSMSRIELMPGDVPTFLGEMVIDLAAPLGRDMGIVTAEDEKELCRDLFATRERVITLPPPKCGGMDVGREPAG